MKWAFKFIVFLTVVAVAACSSGQTKLGDQSATLAEIREAFKVNRGAKRAPSKEIKVTPSLLDASTTSLLEVTVEDNDKTAYLIPAAIRKSSLGEQVVVWKTGDNENVILHSGLLIGTKGLGNDLASADAAFSIRAFDKRANSSGTRAIYVRNDVNGNDKIEMQCEISPIGQKIITVVEKQYQTLHLVEKCTFASGLISNDYWIDSAGQMRQSKQWAGPRLGYLSIRLLKN